MTNPHAAHMREQMKVEGYNANVLHGQGHITHWGIVPKTPCVGVLGNNDPEWLHEDIFAGIDLAWEEHVLTCPNEDHDECGPMDYMGTVLIGFKEIEAERMSDAWMMVYGTIATRGYAPDEDAEYSAIVGEIYTQVVHSKYVQNCELCSPCYPGQGNIEEDGLGDYIAYTLPPDVWGDRVPEGVREWAACIDCGEPGTHPSFPHQDKVHQ